MCGGRVVDVAGAVAGAGAGAWDVGAGAEDAATPFVVVGASAGGVSGWVAGAEP